MTGKKAKEETDSSTEEKIKSAARTIFHKKGFAATRTRDIAEEAGLNLALLNYYFRSKQKLFDLIMLESMQQFLTSMTGMFNDRETSLEKKIELLVSNYIDLLTEEPDIPLFILSELRNNPQELVSKIKVKEVLMKSYLMKQLQQAVEEGIIAPINPLHFIMNIMGLTVFPFIAKPILSHLGDLSDEDFNRLVEQRKALVPKWVKAIMAVG
ncbi:TetR/AcrR family transcriptional regulator [Salmonirosea aquatica]|uniref:TetR family transcriptional regulator n=1 Tax=Salmonirosea aquatica TaxID=2654236 RepID=A0A7C9BHI6_9BACT|nr:TetR family transcriptional regulator [Cytophagaceae bacterium SJW1-29]